MTTIAQVKKLVMPFLDRHSDYTLHGRMVFRRPFDHLLVGMELKAAGHRDQLLSIWFVSTTFQPPPVGRGISGTMDRASGILGLDKVVPEMDLAVTEFLEPLASFEAILASERRVFFGGMDDVTRAIVLIAAGRFDEGEAMLASAITLRERFGRSWQEQFGSKIRPGTKRWRMNQEDLAAEDLYLGTVKRLLGVVATRDRGVLADLLREWELEGARRRGIEQYWQPMPFPFEQSRPA